MFRKLLSVLLINAFVAQPFQQLAQPLHAQEPAARAGSVKAAIAPQENWNIVLTPVSTEFHDHTGLDHHQPSRKLLLSANALTGDPNSFELLAGDGVHSGFSNVAGLQGEVLVATARDDGQGMSRGGFQAGTLFASTGDPGVIARITADGASVENPWVVLPEETGAVTGLHVDRTGVFGGDLIAVTAAGGVWRVNSSSIPTRLAALGTSLAGVAVVPADLEAYGPWAGKVLAGAKEEGSIYAVDAQGQSEALPIGINPQDIDIVPAHENLYAIDPASQKLLAAPEGALTAIIGDVLVTQESPGRISRVRWDGTALVVSGLAEAAGLTQVAFSPSGVAQIPPVKQVYDKIAVVRHAPLLDSGRVEGTLWQLTGETTLLDGTDTITSDLLVPGTPALTVAASASYGGTIEGGESTQPSGYTVTIKGSASLRHVVTRTDPIELEEVAFPPAPAGTRDVELRKSSDTLGDPATLRHLDITGNVGSVAVPPGTYGKFAVGGRNALVFGVEGSTEPAVYNLEELALTGGSQLLLAGPVKLTVRNKVTLVGSTVGAADDPKRLLLEIAGGLPDEALKVGGTGVLYGIVRAPEGTISIEGSGRVRGTVACDVLYINGNGVLQITENDIPPPPVNRPPTVDAGPDHTITLPTDTVALEGSAVDDGLPTGSTLTYAWTKVSGPGSVTFADPASPVTSATFSVEGEYVLKLTASDGQLSSSDTAAVTVIPSNQPPVVDAGPDQTIDLPAPAQLRGTAADDGMPSGSTLEVSWRQISGPAPAIFHDAFATVTAVNFTEPGTYVLRLTASDSELSAYDEMTVVVRPQSFTSRTYTLDADFDEGSLVNVTQDVPNQLQLDDTTQTFNFIWVAVSSKGTVVKINTETGAIIGEYLTSPAGQAKNPSRTTVDQTGSVWATNRDGNSVVHIGLVENGQCVDRNGNGVIDTSTGFGDIRPWPNTGGANTNGGVTLAQDECIVHYTRVSSSGTRHVSVTKDNDVWVSGTGGQRFDLIDGKTGMIKRAEPSVGYGGYGGLIDRNGVIWSARSLLRWDTSKPLTGASGGNWRGYGHDSYGLCIDGAGNVWNTSLGGDRIHKFAPDGTHIGSYSHGNYYAQGCVVDGNGDVWVAHSLYTGSVGHLKNNGVYVGKINVQSGPTGVAVDGKGKIWATNHDAGTVQRIDPNLGPVGADGVTKVGAVDLTTRNLGGVLYNYSDMTGSTLTGAPGAGTWTTVFDSRIPGAEWGRIGWTARSCGDGLLTVSVASSENGTTFGQSETVTNGADPTVVNGRYLRISVSFKRASSGESPVLYDLSVGTAGYTLPAVANAAPTAFAGADLTVTLPDAAKPRGTACDDGFPRGNALAVSWEKVSGPGTAHFSGAGSTTPDVTFTLPGEYVLRLTVNDGEHAASDEVTVTALPANMAPIVNAGADQSVTLPNTVALNGTASDDGLPAGGTLSTFWSQLSGPGVVRFDDLDSPATRAAFPVAGTYTLRLAGHDGQRVGTDDVVVTVNPAPALVGATLTLAAGNVGPYVTGTPQPLTATLKNSAGSPLAGYGVEFDVSGPNMTAGSAVTNASGVATFSYSGTNPGTDTVRALVRNTSTTTVNSGPVTMTWSLTPASPPVLQGWIGGPLSGTTVTGTVPITVGAGVTLTQAKVEYMPAGNPSAVTVLASGAQGGPGATLATLDTTLLANGTYIVRLTATDSNGQELVSQVIITVAGENKPGRVTFAVTDLTVPAAGIPITIKRRYDSLERNLIGDFGYGWSLEMAGPRLEVSPDHDVTITEPGTGRRVSFNFAPTSVGFPFNFLYLPTYSPEPGVYGSLTSDGCGLLIRTSTGVACFLSTDLNYNPTVYAYTDPYGRVYTMTATGKMHSIKDLNGNLLTFSSTGITSSAGGLNVPFVRDGQGRITQITDPEGETIRYDYDEVGDLVAVQLPNVSAPYTYTYEPGHFFSSSTDPRGNAEATTTYHPDGRLASTTDAVGNTTSYDYDLAANRTIITYPDGGVATFTYDANGSLLSKTDPLNHTTAYTYDANRNKLTETNALGQTTTHTYDSRGNLTSTTDAAGKIRRWTYNQVGQPVTATDEIGRVKTTKYDAAYNPVSVEDSLGIRVAYTLDSRGNPLTEANGNGQVTRFTYDAYGHLLTRTDPLGRITSYTYDGMGRILTATDPSGTTRFTYDALGRRLTMTDPLGQVTRFEYDDNGNKTAQVDAAGRRTAYEYDAANRLTRVTNPDSTVQTYTYNFRGQKLTETDQEGNTTSYVYDKAGRKVKVVNPDLTEVTFTYDALDREISKTDERNRTTRSEYDQVCGCRDRLTKTIDALGGVTIYELDAVGRLISQTDPNQRKTRFHYDARNMIQVTYSDGTTTSQTYDGAGRKLTEVDPAGRVTRFAYDQVGNLVAVTDALNQTTVHTYDALNNRLSTTDALGRTTRFEYDALNRMIKRVLPLGMTELYTYDQVGNRVTRSDFRGKQTTYEYDSMNRLVRKIPDPSLGEPTVSFTYHPAGTRESMTDASGTTFYSYDVRQRLLSKQTPQGTLTYTYDAVGKVASVRSSNANGISVDYTYDDLDRLESVVDNQLAGGTTTYSHDAYGNTLDVTLPNGVQTAYTYDGLYRPTQVTHSGGGALASYAQTLDPTGRRLAISEQNGRAVNYTYDALYRLTGETVAGDPAAAANGSVAYNYDAVGNRLSRTSTVAAVSSATSNYDANDRLTADAYDANGNTRSAGGFTFTYTYDFEDRLRSANNGAVRIVYDGDGNRASKTVGGVTTRYLVDDLSPSRYSQVVEELVGGAVERTYTYGERLISQRQRRNGDWQTSFYGYDAYGNVRFLTDGGGAVTDTYTFDAFGLLTAVTGTTPNNYLFNGQQYDRDLGIYFMRARYYSQDRGRFMTLDPVEGRLNEPITLHEYLFGNADPVNQMDPWGTSAVEYSTTVNFAALRAAALTCIRNAAVTMLKEAATEILISQLSIYAIRQANGVLPYVGRTGRTTEVRFAEHLRTSRFADGMEKIGEFTVHVPDLGDEKANRTLAREIEQMVMDAFKGETKLLNLRNEIKDPENYRRIFCQK